MSKDDLPQAPGWYWCERNGGYEPKPMEVFEDDGVLYVHHELALCARVDEINGTWQGPIFPAPTAFSEKWIRETYRPFDVDLALQLQRLADEAHRGIDHSLGIRLAQTAHDCYETVLKGSSGDPAECPSWLQLAAQDVYEERDSWGKAPQVRIAALIAHHAPYLYDPVLTANPFSTELSSLLAEALEIIERFSMSEVCFGGKSKGQIKLEFRERVKAALESKGAIDQRQG